MSPRRRGRECSTPEKKKFKTGEKAAGGAQRLLRDRHITVYIYECECGYWHFTKQEQKSGLITVRELSLEQSERLVCGYFGVSLKVLREMTDAKLYRLLVGKDDS